MVRILGLVFTSLLRASLHIIEAFLTCWQTWVCTISLEKNRRSSRFTDSFYTLQCCIAKLPISWLDLLSNISSGTHLRHGTIILTSKEQSNADDGNFMGKVVQCP